MLAFVISSIAAYSTCNPTTYPFAGQAVTINIGSAPTKAISLNGTLVPVTVAGTITVVDGCRFRVDGFQLSGPASAVWYGGYSGSQDGVTLSDTVVPSGSNPSQTFTFRSVAGASVSYTDFDEFRLFDPASQSIVAIAKLPTPANPMPKTGLGAPAVVSTTKPTASPTAGSNTSPTQVSTINSGLRSQSALFLLSLVI